MDVASAPQWLQPFMVVLIPLVAGAIAYGSFRAYVQRNRADIDRLETDIERDRERNQTINDRITKILMRVSTTQAELTTMQHALSDRLDRIENQRSVP